MFTGLSDAAAAAPVEVLVVDDQEDIRAPLAAYLERQGMRATTADNALEMRRHLRRRPFDLIVLDVMLPDESGLSLCDFVVRTLDTPVILLTAMAARQDRVNGLETGADDYVVKPFDPPELVARIRSVLRRQNRARVAERGHRRFAFEGWTFDAVRGELHTPDGEPVALSGTEQRLLDALLRHPQVPLSRERLLDLTQSGDADPFDRAIDTQISRLRRKLEKDPRRPALIRTARSAGYVFAADVRPLAG
ncbi:response regulator transcription factor [Xylophilus sp. GOD-11R]|uniref:response regulator transcription factor n=1 Tax=Xylophilus sp. GOD-11R TaxID=3089814 RepID=UPI00298CF79B|nr:response regulator transcription factor [Xylophilus sp. GOD-11R]WPB56098.1 response regulator transcription factor [Xylophilus sp. GOD-11R]